MNENKIKISPSIIAADQARLAYEIKRIERAGADLLHIDVMDGNFVPNITIGPGITQALSRVSKLPLDTHLMIANPQKYIKAFADAGSDYITIHIETCKNNAHKVIAQIKACGKKAGISLNPATPLSAIKKLLKSVDMVLVMTVKPGFYGQKFKKSVLPKIKALRKIYKGIISVDGGINKNTYAEVLALGADMLVSGSYVFKAKNAKAAIERLRKYPKK